MFKCLFVQEMRNFSSQMNASLQEMSSEHAYLQEKSSLSAQVNGYLRRQEAFLLKDMLIQKI